PTRRWRRHGPGDTGSRLPSAPPGDSPRAGGPACRGGEGAWAPSQSEDRFIRDPLVAIPGGVVPRCLDSFAEGVPIGVRIADPAAVGEPGDVHVVVLA